MPNILELPVVYRVLGIPKGRRKPVVVSVSEGVPFDVHDIEDPGDRIEFGTSSFAIADRRPWFPVVGRMDQPMTVEAANAASRAFIDIAPGPPEGNLDKTGILPLVGRRIRTVSDKDGGRIVVPSGGDWRASFARVDDTDRVASLAVSSGLAERLRVMDGKVVTDRYEPIEVSNTTPNIDGTFLYDVVTGLLNTVVRQHGGDLSYSPSRTYYDSDLGTLPLEEPWSDLMDWQAAPSELIALWLGRRLRYPLVSEGAGGPAFRDAIGYRGTMAMMRFVAWNDGRDAGEFPTMTDDDLARSIADLREALTSAERLGIPGRIERIEEDLARAEEVLSRAMLHVADPTHEDAEALRMTFA